MATTKKPRYAAFGRALRDAMTAAGYSSKALCAEVDYTPARLTDARWGWRIPTAPLVAKLAAALDAPRLIDVHRATLTTTCAMCQRVFVRGARHRSTADGKRYCSLDCRRAGDNARVKARRDEERPDRLDQATRRVHHLERTVARVTSERDTLQTVIDRFCWSCEPEGACRTPSCTTWQSGKSPLPMADVRLRTA